MAIQHDSIFVGSYYRTQFGEVREVTDIVGGKVVYTAHRATEGRGTSSIPSQGVSIIRFAHDAQKEVDFPQPG